MGRVHDVASGLLQAFMRACCASIPNLKWNIRTLACKIFTKAMFPLIKVTFNQFQQDVGL